MGEHASEVKRARALLKQGEHQKVLDLLRPWLAEHDDDATAWETLGAACYGLQLWESCEDAARQVVFLRPDSARAWSNLGTILRKLGRYEQARQAQVRAIELNPGYDRARLEMDRLRRTVERDKEPPDDLMDDLC